MQIRRSAAYPPCVGRIGNPTYMSRRSVCLLRRWRLLQNQPAITVRRETTESIGMDPRTMRGASSLLWSEFSPVRAVLSPASA